MIVTGTDSTGTLKLSLQDVLSDASTLTATNNNQAVPVAIQTAQGVSTISLAEGVGTGANQWTDAGTTSSNGVTYEVYHNNSQTGTAADLLIQQGIHVI
jgi:hypothetical protein